MAINKMAPEIAGEVLRELGHGTEADQLLIKIRAAKPEEVRELIDNLN